MKIRKQYRLDPHWFIWGIVAFIWFFSYSQIAAQYLSKIEVKFNINYHLYFAGYIMVSGIVFWVFLIKEILKLYISSYKLSFCIIITALFFLTVGTLLLEWSCTPKAI